MKNRAKKMTIIGSGVCFFALLVAFLIFVSRPYTEKVIIWLPDNCELENTVSNGVILMPNLEDVSQSNPAIFYSLIDLDSFKKLVGKNEKVSVSIRDASDFIHDQYKVVYQIKHCIDGNKILIVLAKVNHGYKRRSLFEMRLSQDTLFVKYKKDGGDTRVFLTFAFIVIAFFVYILCRECNIDALKKHND